MNLGVSLVTTPGLEQAVLLVLEMEPLLYLYPFFCRKQLQSLVSQHLLSEVEL